MGIVVTLDQLFSLAGAAAMVGWLALAVVPLRYRAPRLVALGVALAIAMLYAALIGVYWSGAQGGFGSLAEVALLFQAPGLLLAGWVHYLAFDLLVGAWEREQARELGLPQWLLVPCLLLTFLFGPLGWLVFMGLRMTRLRAARPVAEQS